jgi:hypothetical protein
MEFRLTYAGPLWGAQNNARVAHKRDLRRIFHLQLRHFWDVNPYLKHGNPVAFDWASTSVPKSGVTYGSTIAEWLAPLYQRNAYSFVPLVRRELSLLCTLQILFLRPDVPGGVVTSGDIDNRLKTLFDALRLPKGDEELRDYCSPAEDEKPFYCLLEDDSLITGVSVETDMLLEPVSEPPTKNDARLVIGVTVRPFNTNPGNINFS